jgi:hypothetical protein
MILFLQLFLLISCSTQFNKSNKSDTELQFKKFINRQNIIKLPARIDLYKSSYNLIFPEISDTSIFHESTNMGILGILEDTLKYYYVIPMYPGDDLCPLLYVFSKNGDIIEKSRLIVGKYGPDCGSYINGYTTISKDLKIFTQDSLAQYFCDSIGNELKDSLTIFVTTQEMNIMSNGKVKQEKEKEKIIK